MRLTKPLPLTLISTNVADSTLSEFNIATSYSLGSKVKVTVGATWPYHEYESLSNDNVGNQPQNSSDMWLDLGPTNRLAMFDDRTGTVTTNTSKIEVSVSTGAYFDTIALLGLDGVISIEISVSKDSVEIYNNVISMVEQSSSWFDYYFGDRDNKRTKLIVSPEVFFSDTVISVTMTGATGESVGCGLMMCGRSVNLGITEYGVSVGIEDYSSKETDEFGRSYLRERGFADTASVKLRIPTGMVDVVKNKLSSVRAMPALYDMNSTVAQYESLVIFGKYDDFSTTIDYHDISYCSLSLTGLIQ